MTFRISSSMFMGFRLDCSVSTGIQSFSYQQDCFYTANNNFLALQNFRVSLYLITMWSIRNKLKANRFRHRDVVREAARRHTQSRKKWKNAKRKNHPRKLEELRIESRTKDFFWKVDSVSHHGNSHELKLNEKIFLFIEWSIQDAKISRRRVLVFFLFQIYVAHSQLPCSLLRNV